MTSKEIYLQSIDKQRILVVGGGNHLISAIIGHTLKLHHRKFDQSYSGATESLHADSPVIIYCGDTQLIDYKHHILILGIEASGDDLIKFQALADATPKGGTIIYPKAHAPLSKIGSIERTDVQAIGYEVYKHELVEGKTVLISSTKDRFTIELHGNLDLQCVSAAKELLKKIGITSGQFYKTISTFKPL